MPLIVLETAPPDCRAGEREWVERSRRLIDEMSMTGLKSREIIRKIQDDPNLPNPLRNVALGEDIERRFPGNRDAIVHPGGEALCRRKIWCSLLTAYSIVLMLPANWR